MTKKRRTGLTIGAVAACIVALCAAGACNGIGEDEKAVHPAVTTSTTVITTTTTLPTMTAPVTTTAKTTVVATTESQITTTVTCFAAEQGLHETLTLLKQNRTQQPKQLFNCQRNRLL